MWTYRHKFLDLYAKNLAGTPGDCDPDGDVDLYDFACFQRCFGQSAPLSEACTRMDMNEDTTVDLDDYALFAPLLLGPNQHN